MEGLETGRAGQACGEDRDPKRNALTGLWPDANRAFYASHVWQTVFDPRGRRVFKYPTDLWAYKELLETVQPAVIVETGSAEGGSAAWFADYAEVVSIDPVQPEKRDKRVHWITGSSTDPDVIARVYERVRGRSCLVTLDSDHDALHVEAELEAYAPLVTPGSYLIVEDTAVDVYGIDLEFYPNGGPGVAVERFLERDNHFSPDRTCERFMLGMNPGGWLRRI